MYTLHPIRERRKPKMREGHGVGECWGRLKCAVMLSGRRLKIYDGHPMPRRMFDRFMMKYEGKGNQCRI